MGYSIIVALQARLIQLVLRLRAQLSSDPQAAYVLSSALESHIVLRGHVVQCVELLLAVGGLCWVIQMVSELSQVWGTQLVSELLHHVGMHIAQGQSEVRKQRNSYLPPKPRLPALPPL